MYVPVYVGVSAAMCVRACARAHTQVPACAHVRVQSGGRVRACVCMRARDLFSFILPR